MAPKNRPYPHLQDLWVWNWTHRLGGGRSQLVRPLSWQILGKLLQWNFWSCARSIWQSKWIAGISQPSWPITGAVILVYLRIPVHTMTTLLMKWLNQRMRLLYLSQWWLLGLPDPILRSPSLSLPGYYIASCPRTPQETIPFYRPWARHLQLRQTCHLWVLRLWTMMASPIWQHTWRSWRTFWLNIAQRPPKSRASHRD